MALKIKDYTPQGGVCSRLIHCEVEDGIVRQISFLGGCQGNTQGVAALAQGRPVEEVIRCLQGIDCKGKGTSCPDQLAHVLRELSK